MLRWATWVILLPLPGINKLPGKPVPIMHIVSAAAPQPITGKVTRSGSSAAAAGRQLALTACPTDGVDHASGADGIGEGCFSGAWWRENRRVGLRIEPHSLFLFMAVINLNVWIMCDCLFIHRQEARVATQANAPLTHSKEPLTPLNLTIDNRCYFRINSVPSETQQLDPTQ